MKAKWLANGVKVVGSMMVLSSFILTLLGKIEMNPWDAFGYALALETFIFSIDYSLAQQAKLKAKEALNKISDN